MASGVGAMYSYLQNGSYSAPLWIGITLTLGVIFIIWVGRNW